MQSLKSSSVQYIQCSLFLISVSGALVLYFEHDLFEICQCSISTNNHTLLQLVTVPEKFDSSVIGMHRRGITDSQSAWICCFHNLYGVMRLRELRVQKQTNRDTLHVTEATD